MGLIWRGWWIGGSWGYIISPKVKLATVVTLDRLGKGVFRVCVCGEEGLHMLTLGTIA